MGPGAARRGRPGYRATGARPGVVADPLSGDPGYLVGGRHPGGRAADGLGFAATPAGIGRTGGDLRWRVVQRAPGRRHRPAGHGRGDMAMDVAAGGRARIPTGRHGWSDSARLARVPPRNPVASMVGHAAGAADRGGGNGVLHLQLPLHPRRRNRLAAGGHPATRCQAADRAQRGVCVERPASLVGAA